MVMFCFTYHGHAAYDFASLSGCEQLVAGATHKSGNRLDLVLTNVPGIIEVNVLPPVGSSDHCLSSCRVSTYLYLSIVLPFGGLQLRLIEIIK